MRNYTIRHLLAAIGTDTKSLPGALCDRAFSGVSTNTRTVRPGDVFFGIRGERFDGGTFAGNALSAGAALAIVNRDTPVDAAPVVRVDDTVRALGDAARDYRSRFTGKVVAVTGTNGKTTVKEMLLAVLGRRFRTHGTAGNLNNHIGLPLSVLGLTDDHECAVFELGMSAPGEIGYLADIAKPDIGIILNAGPAHMEFFGSLDRIADAKTELLRALAPEKTAVMNGDDPLLRARENGARCRIVRFGVETAAEFRAEDIEIGPEGAASFRVGETTVALKVPGRHNVYNALAAWSAGRLLGLDSAEIADALGGFRAPEMRLQTVEADGVRFINDSYNANPLSMRAAADVLRNTTIPRGGRLIVVLGDMRELGEISGSAHEEIGGLFGGLRPALLLLVGGNASFYREGALRSGLDAGVIHMFGTTAEAVPALTNMKRPGDVIFLKGSRALGLERLIPIRDGEF